MQRGCAALRRPGREHPAAASLRSRRVARLPGRMIAIINEPPMLMSISPPMPPRFPSADRLPVRRFFVSRHAGAIEWAKRYPWGLRARFIAHLDVEQIIAGDVVIGTLPIQIAAEVCARGAQYLHLAIPLAADQRGKELSAAEIEEAGACLVPCWVTLRWRK